MKVIQVNTSKVNQLGVGFYDDFAFIVQDAKGFFTKKDIEHGVFSTGLIKNYLTVEGLIPLMAVEEVSTREWALVFKSSEHIENHIFDYHTTGWSKSLTVGDPEKDILTTLKSELQLNNFSVADKKAIIKIYQTLVKQDKPPKYKKSSSYITTTQ